MQHWMELNQRQEYSDTLLLSELKQAEKYQLWNEVEHCQLHNQNEKLKSKHATNCSNCV